MDGVYRTGQEPLRSSDRLVFACAACPSSTWRSRSRWRSYARSTPRCSCSPRPASRARWDPIRSPSTHGVATFICSPSGREWPSWSSRLSLRAASRAARCGPFYVWASQAPYSSAWGSATTSAHTTTRDSSATGTARSTTCSSRASCRVAARDRAPSSALGSVRGLRCSGVLPVGGGFRLPCGRAPRWRCGESNDLAYRRPKGRRRAVPEHGLSRVRP